jgi:hypothetical protein
LSVVVALVVVASCVFSFDPFYAPLVTIEGPWFGRFVSTSLLVVQALISLSLLQFVFLWSALKQLLERMAWHPLAGAYERVPRELFPTGLFPRVPRLMELQIPVAHWQHCISAARLAPDTGGIPAECLDLSQVFQEEMRTSPTKHWSETRTWSVLMNAASHTAARLQVEWKSGSPVQRRVPHPASLGSGAEGTHRIAGPVTTDLVDQADASSTAREHEELVAMSMVFVVRDALARLGHNLFFVSTGVLLVFCSHTLFPFQAHQQLAILGWTYVGLTFAAILTVLVQMKRNDIISRLTSATPGDRTTWDGAFVLKLGVFGLLPLITLFATQFPDVGAMLLNWLEPIEKALP